jgi:uncharacterized protein (TIGR00369 family)
MEMRAEGDLTEPGNVPAGFQPLNLGDGLAGSNGPIFWRDDERNGGVVFGMFIDARHCNPMGNCHGGWLATFLDVVLPLTARFTVLECEERFFLTVNLTVDYLAPVKRGDWLEGKARVLKSGGRMVFVDGVLDVAGQIVARGSTVLKLGPEAPPVR